MAFNRGGDLFVATGDQGEIHSRSRPTARARCSSRSDETHVRSLAIDASGNLIVGTEPGGLVIRVSPAGAGFVLYQMAKKEVTAVAVGPDGAIYAAAVGTKQAAQGSGSSAPQAAPAQISINPQAGAAGAAPQPRPPSTPPPPSLGASAVTGGSEVYRIDPGGTPRRYWTHAQDVVYAIAFDQEGRVLLGTGNKGNLYRIESATQYTLMLNVPCTQITAFGGGNGHLYAVTGNVGKVYEIGPALRA